MKQALSREHRRILETSVARARAIAEDGAAKALQALAVGAKEVPAHATEAQRKLRVRLRAHGRALGDTLRGDDSQTIDHLVNEIAYEQWHRMLFARFLAESDLLMHPDGYPVSLSDCKEDAASFDPPARSEWEVAGHYASQMLPNVFRPDSPGLALQLPLETEQALEAILAKLPVSVFQADDSLGWSYQFWQAPKKEEVQKQMKQAGTKVGAEELPAVTQLFTEQYMVAFLLENALGAWWQSRHPRMKLAVDMPYFRKLDDGAPAAGTFPAWPDSLADFKLLDPCAGSGHFLVSALNYLVPMRCAAEKISVREAVDRVLEENLHGLELDARCVEIAAFALAFAAWRYPDEKGNALGYRPLPRMNIACVGLAPRSKKADWLKFAGGDERLEGGMAALYALFQKAPELGSLIDPAAATRGDLIDAHWEELESRLEQALAKTDDDQEIEARVVAQGMMHASRILTRKYHLVITNPPFLGLEQQGEVLEPYVKQYHSVARRELALTLFHRCLKLAPSGSLALVLPGEWTFVRSNREFRKFLLDSVRINLLANLGIDAFVTKIRVSPVLIICSPQNRAIDHKVSCIDVSSQSLDGKPQALINFEFVRLDQDSWRSAPDNRLLQNHKDEYEVGVISIDNIADARNGLSAGDGARFEAHFWEVRVIRGIWEPLQSSIPSTQNFGGRDRIVRWENENGEMAELAESVKHLNHAAQNWRRGKPLWGHIGIVVNQIGANTAIYSGDRYDGSCFAIVPNESEYVPALLAFAQDGELKAALKKINPTWNLKSPKTLLQLPLDISYWKKVASDRYPNGLPKPYSDDPTQWIFHGHPKPATDSLQVAVARLLGYRWPAESDKEMELSDEARSWIAHCKDLDGLTDDDGIVCLPPVRGEQAAETRLRALLARAFGSDWSAAKEAQLLKDAGCEDMTLSQWLRDRFFEQHVARFQRRPFIWHIWDGHKEGFSALVNYHLLTREKLNTLINLYLGDWITQQKRAVDAGNPDAPIKLARAEALKTSLEAILEGEKPYDIFVRWKPLHQQPLGWDPDINDGVRMNIRPFIEAGVLRLPRAKMGIKWEADRGKDVASAPWFKLGPEYDEPEGTRINNHHTTLTEKRAAREKAKK